MSTVQKFYSSKGLDLTSSDYSRPEDFHSGMENLVFEGAADDPVIESRKGYQVKGNPDAGFGLFEFVRLKPGSTDRASEEEKQLLALGENLYIRTETYMTVTYSGAATVCTLSLKYDEAADQMKIVITADGVVAYSANLGRGFDEASPVTINTIKTAIDALADYTATITGTTSIPAAFFDVTVEHDLKAGSATLYAYEWSAVEFPCYQINSGTLGDDAKPFFLSNIFCQDQENYEAPTPVALNNVLYIPNGYQGALMKYDGQRIYKAGLPAPTAPTLVDNGAGTISTAGTYTYKSRYVHVDATGGIYYGPFSEESTITIVANRDINIKTEYAMDDSYNVAAARTNGTVTSTTITVDSGHQIKQYDRVFIRSGTSYVERIVTSTTSTTIVLNSSATATDNHIISAGLRIQFYRKDPGSTIFRLAADVPTTDASTTIYVEDTAATLTEELTEPEYDFGPPPPCKYVATYKGSLVVSGIPSTYDNRNAEYKRDGTSYPNDVWFGDYENLEGFPTDGSFSVSVASEIGDKVSGLREVGHSLVVFKDRSICRLTGDQTQLDMQLEWLSKEVGCLAHASIKELNGQLIFLSNRGVEALSETQPPDQKLGYRIQTMIKNQGLTQYEQLKFKRAIAHSYIPKQLYILFCPAENGTASETFSHTPGGDGGATTVARIYANSNSRAFVYDWLRGSWYEWRDLNMAGGICTFEDDLWFAERRYSTYDSAVVYRAMRRLDNYDASDYQDHIEPITKRLKTAWYNAGSPKIPKQFVRLVFSTIPRIPNNSCTMTIKQEVNYIADSTKAQTTVSLDADSTLNYSAPHTRLANGKFKSTRLIFENAENLSCPEIEGWELEIDAQYIEELKK